MSDYTGTVRRLHCRDSTHNNSADDEHIYSTISDLSVPSAHQPQHQHYRRKMQTQFDIEDQTKQCATDRSSKQNINSSWQEYWRWCDHFICLLFCVSFVSLFLIEFFVCFRFRFRIQSNVMHISQSIWIVFVVDVRDS